MELQPHIIFIDGYILNNIVCEKIVRITLRDAVVHTFTNPEEGLSYIQNLCSTPLTADVILFLDIYMPLLNGWDLLESLKDNFDTHCHNLKIFILSGSLNDNDRKRAEKNPQVTGYIDKPMTAPILLEILKKYE